MDENKELLEFIYEASDMGKHTVTSTLSLIKDKDNKIKKCTEDILKGYEEFYKKSKNALLKLGEKGNKSGLMAKFGSMMGIKKEIDKDNSDAAIAGMIMQGLTMGVVETSVKIDNYKDIVDKKSISLANDFLKFQESSVENLKKFL